MNDKGKKGEAGKESLPEDVELFDTIFREELIAEKKRSQGVKTGVRKVAPSGDPKSSQMISRGTTATMVRPQRRAASSKASTQPQKSRRSAEPARESGSVMSPRGKEGAAWRAKLAPENPGNPKGPAVGERRKAAPKTRERRFGARTRTIKARRGKASPGAGASKGSRHLKPLLAIIGLIIVAVVVLQYLKIFDFGMPFLPVKADKGSAVAPSSIKQKVPVKTAPGRPVAPPAPPMKEQAVKGGSSTQQHNVPPKEAPPVALKSPPPSQTAMAESPSVYPYSVYVGSYRTLEGAERAVSLYSGMGLSPYWTKVDLGKKGIWYRVFAGRFRTLREAEAFIQEKRIPGAEAQKTPPVASQGKTLEKTPVPDVKPAPPAGGEVPRQSQKAVAESAPACPYSLYLGSYRDLERARAAVSRYAEMGLSPYWAKVDLKEKGVWYRVFAGHFQTQGEADGFIKRKQIPEAGTKRTKYAVLIGSYRTEADADRMRSQLMRLGFSSYVIGKGEGDLRLYVGAFQTAAGAQEQQSELASKGIQGKGVRR